MIDFHTHILPGIDDGSHDVEMSIRMLQEEQKNGVEHVVFTPHFYANRDSIDNFLKRRRKSIVRLMEEIEKHRELSGLRYDFGAEVYYFSGIGNATDISKLCIAGTDILLLEMPFCQWTDAMHEDVGKLIRKQGLTVVLAHIERYIEFQKKKDVWNQIFELPVIAQMNAGPFTRWNSRGKVIRLAKEREQILLGSDAHNMENRRPNLAEAQNVIRKKLGEEFLSGQEQLEHQLLGEQMKDYD